MKSFSLFKSTFVFIVALLYIVLFTYAALSKLFDFQSFQVQLGQSPLLSAYTGIISYTILGVELLIVLLLVFPRTRMIGLMSSFVLMLFFTFYIVLILNYASFVPCSCGGILEKLGWKEHLLFNIVFVLIGGIALLISSMNLKRIVKFLVLIVSLGFGGMLWLYYSSEKAMHHENPFIRRFIQGTAMRTKEVQLKNHSQYFVGASQNFIFIGDTKAPLYITVYDILLGKKQEFKIQLEREDFPFRSVRVKVMGTQFYLMDGTVPVIYGGNISDWKAKPILFENNYYFSKAEVIDRTTLAFRAQHLKTLDNILGIFKLGDSLQVSYQPQLLQKQIDGFFDTDGIMLFSPESQRFIYVYYYRNQFIVADRSLNLIYRGNTIDTNTIAKIKVATIEKTRQIKLSSPPYLVNKTAAISKDFLFVNSAIMGQYESKKMWSEASIVDVYGIEDSTYLSSIYLYNVTDSKLKEMIIVGDNLYAIVGSQLHQYSLGRHLKRTHGEQ